MSKIIFCGGEIDSVSIVSGSPVEITTAGTFDSSYCRLSISCPGSTDKIRKTYMDPSTQAAVSVVTGETLSDRFDMHLAGSHSTVINSAEYRDASDLPWLAVRCPSSNVHGLYYNSNTGASPTWTLIGSTFTTSNTTRQTYNVKLTLGSPHTAEITQDGTLRASGTFTQASLTAIRSCVHAGNSVANRFSQFLATEGVSTINGHSDARGATAVGNTNAWTSGTYTDINEAVVSDATVRQSVTASQKYTDTISDITVPGGYNVAAVFTSLRAKNDGAAPSNIQAVIRSGGTDTLSGNLPGLGTSFGPIMAAWALDPNGSAAWDQTRFNAIEVGAQSAT